MRTLCRIEAIFLVCLVAAGAQAQSGSAKGCAVSAVQWEGWNAQQISNQWVRLIIVPQLGGRLMQVSFRGHDYLFVNPKYKGRYIPPSEAGQSWINYGGDKIWPLPEGNQDEHHWVLKSDPLDDGEYSFHSSTQNDGCSAVLQGPPDPVTGLQYSREISVSPDSPRISFHAVMKNIAKHPITWSVQSVTQYNLADHSHPETFNRNFYAYTPVNSHSAYFGSYQVRAGLADDPSFEIRDGIFRLHWLYLDNEVWLDSPAGWAAVVDGDSQFSMIETFQYQTGAQYPGAASVIFYKNGVGLSLDENLAPKMSPASPDQTPYYMEAELNSPMITLQPGENYAFDTAWFPSRSTAEVLAVHSAGIVSKHLQVDSGSGGLVLTGTFGLFYAGRVRAVFLDAHGTRLGEQVVAEALPSDLLALHAEVKPPPGTTRVSVQLMDEDGSSRGVVDEADVPAAGGTKS